MSRILFPVNPLFQISFKFEKCFFTVEAAGVAGEFVCAADDAMTGDDDADWITSDGTAGGARG